MQTVLEVRRHVEHKMMVRELDAEVGSRMLTALADGAAPDYPALLEAATFLSPPPVCFHTASATSRAAIAAVGLLPGDERNWTSWQQTGSQPVGVYLGPAPDVRGVWAHWSQWDVWEVDMTGLAWVHDRLNPGCWSVPSTIPPSALTLHGTYPGTD